MVATIRPEAKEVSVFSIPRDTRVAIKGHNQDKINHAMAYGGIPLILDSVENLLNIKIDHYVKVNFDGFINVIDALGRATHQHYKQQQKSHSRIQFLFLFSFMG